MPDRLKSNEARRATILAGALELFSGRPPEEVTVAMVADRAGLSYWQVFRYYSNPAQLFRAAVNQLMNGISDRIALPEGRPGGVHEAILLFTRRAQEIIAGEAYKQMLYMIIRESPYREWVREKYESCIAAKLKSCLAQCIETAGRGHGALVNLPEQARQKFVRELEFAFALPKLLPGSEPLAAEDVEKLLGKIAGETFAATYTLAFETEAA
ncbi:MAG: TetR/AcrR family transcriptional regulator [Sphingomonadaceae bacterium]